MHAVPFDWFPLKTIMACGIYFIPTAAWPSHPLQADVAAAAGPGSSFASARTSSRPGKSFALGLNAAGLLIGVSTVQLLADLVIG